MAESQFLGEVSASELINGTDLCTAIGLSGYSGANNNEPWLKFYDAVDNKTKFIAKKGYGTSWSGVALHANGLDVGKTIQIGGVNYKVRLISGANVDIIPPSIFGNDVGWTHGSEWNRLMYHIYGGELGTYDSEPGAPGDWAQYTDLDLGGSETGNAGCTTCAGGGGKILRGRFGNDSSMGGGASAATSSANETIGFMFRPLLELDGFVHEDTPFKGEVPASELISGDELATRLNFSGGTSDNSDAGWLMFVDPEDGLTKLIAKMPIRFGVSYTQLNAAGLVSGDKTIEIKGQVYKVRLVSGTSGYASGIANVSDPAITQGCEWNRLLYHICTEYAGGGTEGLNQRWAEYSGDEIGVKPFSWCQELGTTNGNTEGAVIRGYHNITNFSVTGLDNMNLLGWRPVLEYVGPSEELETPFKGEVPASELITGSALSNLLGISNGTLTNSNSPWLKFEDPVDGKTKYISKQHIRTGVSWDQINNVGAVFGRVIYINDEQYRVRLIGSSITDPAGAATVAYDGSFTHGSEWNRLIYHIAVSSNASDRFSSEPGAPGDWAQYTATDIDAQSIYTLCRERFTNGTPIIRGHNNGAISINSSTVASNTGSSLGWRPVLEYIGKGLSTELVTPEGMLAGPRTDGINYYPEGTPPGGQATQWAVVNNRVQSTVNSSRIVALLTSSPYLVGNIDVVVGSTNSDNDGIGIVLAHRYYGGTNHMIVAARSGGGMANYGGNFSVFYTTDGNTRHTSFFVTNLGSNAGWSGRTTRLRMERDGTRFFVASSDWYSDALTSSTTFDLANFPAINAIFSAETAGNPFGFWAQSQPDAFFSMPTIEADIEPNKRISQLPQALLVLDKTITDVNTTEVPQAVLTKQEFSEQYFSQAPQAVLTKDTYGHSNFSQTPQSVLVEQPNSDQRFSQTPQAILAIDDDHAVTNTSQMAQALLVGQKLTDQYFSQTPQSLLIVDDQDPTIYVSSFYANIIFSYDYGFTNVTQVPQAMLIVQPPPEFRTDQVARTFLAIDEDGPTRLSGIAQSLLKLQYFSDQNVTQVPQSLLVKEDESVFFMTFRALRLPEMETLYTSNTVRAFVTEGTDYIQLEGNFPEGSYLIRNGEPVGLTTPVAEGDYIAIHSGVMNYFTASINIYKYGWKDGQVVRQMVGLWPVIQPSLDAVLRREQSTRSNYLSWLYDMHTGFSHELLPDFYQNKSFSIEAEVQSQKHNIMQLGQEQDISKPHLALLESESEINKHRAQSINLPPVLGKHNVFDINLPPVLGRFSVHDINLLPVRGIAHSKSQDLSIEINEQRVLKFALLPDFRLQNIESGNTEQVRGSVQGYYSSISPDAQKSNETSASTEYMLGIHHNISHSTVPVHSVPMSELNTSEYLSIKYKIIQLKMEYDRIVPNLNIVDRSVESGWGGIGIVDSEYGYFVNKAHITFVDQSSEYTIPVPSLVTVGAVSEANTPHAETTYTYSIPISVRSDLVSVRLEKEHRTVSVIGYEFTKYHANTGLFGGQYKAHRHLVAVAGQNYHKYTVLPRVEVRSPYQYSPNSIFSGQHFVKYVLAQVHHDQNYVKYVLEVQLVSQEFNPISFNQFELDQEFSPDSIGQVNVEQNYDPVSIGQVGIQQEYSPVSISQVGVGQEFIGESIGSTLSQQYHFKTTYTPKVIKQTYVITKTSYAKADLYAEAPKAKANYFYSAGRYGGYDTVQELRAYTEYFYEVNELRAYDGYRYTTDVDLTFTCELFSNGPVKWLLQGG